MKMLYFLMLGLAIFIFGSLMLSAIGTFLINPFSGLIGIGIVGFLSYKVFKFLYELADDVFYHQYKK